MIRLAELRRQEGISQKELAKKLNMSAGNLCDWEKGRTEPDVERLIAIADFFDVSLDYLVGREENVVNYNFKPDETKIRLLYAYSRLTDEQKIKLVEFLELTAK